VAKLLDLFMKNGVILVKERWSLKLGFR